MRRILITGAASGLAAGIASHLGRRGFERIAFTYRNTSPQNTLDALSREGVRADAVRIDFGADAAQIQSELDDCVRAHGPFDTLVHAVGPLVVKRFERTTLDDYREMFDGNVRSTVLASRAVLPAMREAKFGRIVVFGMNGSSETRPYRGFTLYQAAKSAVVAFARCLAVEEAKHGITVNAIEPGDIRQKTLTRAQALESNGPTPRGRPGSYEDIADAVAFFVAPERDFITGSVLAVTGGLTQADERNAIRP
ncbi:MAG: SDR family oxidoreductase [Candidatus Eremiobacteraeota bacterium]|nr:SDR family oxidoreductase [Candidatus Eremiobacteraeota bacterium]